MSHCVQCNLTTQRSLRAIARKRERMEKRFAYNRTAHLIERRYPRIIRLMQFAACLSIGEATACIRDYVAGNDYSSEAVARYGGATAVLQSVARLRTNYAIRSLDRGNWWDGRQQPYNP